MRPLRLPPPAPPGGDEPSGQRRWVHPEAHLQREPRGLTETQEALAFAELRGARTATLRAADEAQRASEALREAQQRTDDALARLALL